MSEYREVVCSKYCSRIRLSVNKKKKKKTLLLERILIIIKVSFAPSILCVVCIVYIVYTTVYTGWFSWTVSFQRYVL